jgi:pyruvate/oxaloacetate carboxyltransferase
MKEIHFVDTTLRDGQLSLWASNMTIAKSGLIEQLYRK